MASVRPAYPSPVLWPRPARRSFVRRIALRRLGLWAIFAALSIAVLWFVGRALIRLPWRVVNEVSVVGTRYVDPQRVRNQTPVRLGQPLFGVDADSVIVHAEALPWVERASVKRRLSGRFEIHITERVPVGVLWNDGFFLMDASGYTVPLEGTAPPDVPLVTGVSQDSVRRHAALAQVGRMLGVIAALAPLRSVVSEVSLADSTMVVMILSPKGAPVWLPRWPGRDRLVMVASLIARHPDVVRRARYLDARFAGHVAVNVR